MSNKTYTVDSVPGVLFNFIGYETRVDGSTDYDFAWMNPEGEDAPDVFPIMEIHVGPRELRDE